MKDFIGQELGKGDVVAVTPKDYRGLVKATVAAFTPKQVRLQYFNHNNYLIEYLTLPSSVIKIPVNE
jgi:hypothetical protein